MLKDIHDRFVPDSDRERLLAWVIAGLGNDASIGTAREMISDAIKIARINQPLGG